MRTFKQFILSLLLVLICSAVHAAPKEKDLFGDVSVRGYTKRDGTYVAPHMRSRPDKSFDNNWSTRGNVNPYTGKPGTKDYPSYGGVTFREHGLSSCRLCYGKGVSDGICFLCEGQRKLPSGATCVSCHGTGHTSGKCECTVILPERTESVITTTILDIYRRDDKKDVFEMMNGQLWQVEEVKGKKRVPPVPLPRSVLIQKEGERWTMSIPRITNKCTVYVQRLR